jgi:hypothetical protein
MSQTVSVPVEATAVGEAAGSEAPGVPVADGVPEAAGELHPANASTEIMAPIAIGPNFLVSTVATPPRLI